jgi:flagellar hook-length control protein FliK
MPAPATHANAQGGEVDRGRFIQRVARAFHAAGERGGQVRLRLSPPELGALQLEISMKDGAITAHVAAETPEARTLLLNSLPQLRERLEQQDIRIDKFDVELMDQSPGGLQQNAEQNHDSRNFTRRAANVPQVSIAAPPDEPATNLPTQLISARQLNVVV